MPVDDCKTWVVLNQWVCMFISRQILDVQTIWDIQRHKNCDATQGQQPDEKRGALVSGQSASTCSICTLHVTHSMWHTQWDTLNEKHSMWHSSCGTRHMTHSMWHTQCGTLHVTHSVTHFMWHTLCDTHHVTLHMTCSSMQGHSHTPSSF